MEFGAHQVILVRSLEDVEGLPEEFTNSNALTMTVPQAKGLEFDDVRSPILFKNNTCHASLG